MQWLAPEWPMACVMDHAVAWGGCLVALSGLGASEAGPEPTEGPAPQGTSNHPPTTDTADGEVPRIDWQ